MTDIREAAETAAEILLNGGYVERWVEGAIFPSEMAFFIAVCSVAGVDRVIESGRQDGYSTEILGDWASHNGRQIASVDLEHDAARAAACRQRLAHLPIQLVKGSAYEEFGRLVRDRAGRRLALIADGPKGWPAISMMAAGVDDRVEVVALHNLIPGSAVRELFERLGGPQTFYERALNDPGPRWQELRAREIAFAGGTAARSLELSSLGVLRLDDTNRSLFTNAWRTEFGLHQPAMVRALWQLGAYSAATKLYGLSYRLLRR
ncbi:hypothetical protein CCR97_02990 [Rhodoplanes elegans]|uniref:SAM-dependent methyltransferase n=1 Tax=Rhodoplanes elegans TaxID=29408 RepID=A0A327KN80_9BRAD|nr:hypothetical protein [Rhodoplanes elegans]MBK5957174.1 hypothetical protein [Rhodoplanes elegans]RAI40350.1 hypothetical protein CH338_06525 [Rhodoplanes elegans]